MSIGKHNYIGVRKSKMSVNIPTQYRYSLKWLLISNRKIASQSQYCSDHVSNFFYNTLDFDDPSRLCFLLISEDHFLGLFWLYTASTHISPFFLTQHCISLQTAYFYLIFLYVPFVSILNPGLHFFQFLINFGFALPFLLEFFTMCFQFNFTANFGILNGK